MNIARRYAEALFALGNRQMQRADNLTVLAQALSVPEIARLWCDPQFVHKKELVNIAVTKVDKKDLHLRNLLLVLVDNKRQRLLPQVAEAYRQLVKQELSIVEVTVTSSHVLAKKKCAQIEKIVADCIDGQIKIEFVVDNELLGGLTIAWQHRLWDFSLRSKLQAIIKHSVS